MFSRNFVLRKVCTETGTQQMISVILNTLGKLEAYTNENTVNACLAMAIEEEKRKESPGTKNCELSEIDTVPPHRE